MTLLENHFKVHQMLYQQFHKNYHPPRYVAFKHKSHSKDQRAPSLQHLQICHHKQTTNDVTGFTSKRKDSYSTTHKSSTTTLTPFNYQPPRSSQHNECLLIIECMDKKIKELMREASALMEIVLNSAGKEDLYVELRKKLKAMEDRQVEKQYLCLREKITEYWKPTLEQSKVDVERRNYEEEVNPESEDRSRSKVSRLQLETVLTLSVAKTIQETEQYSQTIFLDNTIATFSQTDPLCNDAISSPPINYSHCRKVSDSNMKHRVTYLSNKASHFKRRYSKIQSELQYILKEKEETDKINSEVAEEIIKLRAQFLNGKYHRI